MLDSRQIVGDRAIICLVCNMLRQGFNSSPQYRLFLQSQVGAAPKPHKSVAEMPQFSEKEYKLGKTRVVNLEEINKVTSLSIMLTVFSKGRFQHA